MFLTFFKTVYEVPPPPHPTSPPPPCATLPTTYVPPPHSDTTMSCMQYIYGSSSYKVALETPSSLSLLTAPAKTMQVREWGVETAPFELEVFSSYKIYRKRTKVCRLLQLFTNMTAHIFSQTNQGWELFYGFSSELLFFVSERAK